MDFQWKPPYTIQDSTSPQANIEISTIADEVNGLGSAGKHNWQMYDAAKQVGEKLILIDRKDYNLSQWSGINQVHLMISFFGKK